MTSTFEFHIRNINVIDGKENQIGNRLLAIFDLETTGVIVIGCVLILKADGVIIARGPIGKSHSRENIGARFDPALADAIKCRAYEIYKLFTGRQVGAA